MNRRSMTRGLVLALLALGALPAAAKDHAFSFDKKVKFPRTNIAPLKIKAGPLTFTEVIIRNPPNAGDIKNAQTKDPGDNCHPKLQVGVSNGGDREMKFHVTVSLEDDAGNVYLTCDREDDVDAGADNDHTNLCWLDSMKTIDWPRLTVVRVRADIDPED